jgi:hypothetical protein
MYLRRPSGSGTRVMPDVGLSECACLLDGSLLWLSPGRKPGSALIEDALAQRVHSLGISRSLLRPVAAAAWSGGIVRVGALPVAPPAGRQGLRRGVHARTRRTRRPCHPAPGTSSPTPVTRTTAKINMHRRVPVQGEKASGTVGVTAPTISVRGFSGPVRGFSAPEFGAYGRIAARPVS